MRGINFGFSVLACGYKVNHFNPSVFEYRLSRDELTTIFTRIRQAANDYKNVRNWRECKKKLACLPFFLLIPVLILMIGAYIGGTSIIGPLLLIVLAVFVVLILFFQCLENQLMKKCDSYETQIRDEIYKINKEMLYAKELKMVMTASYHILTIYPQYQSTDDSKTLMMGQPLDQANGAFNKAQLVEQQSQVSNGGNGLFNKMFRGKEQGASNVNYITVDQAYNELGLPANGALGSESVAQANQI